MVVVLLAENVLFLQCISLSKRLDDVIQHVLVSEILVGVRAILLHRVLHLDNHGAVPLLREQHGIEVFPFFIFHVLQLREQPVHVFFLARHSCSD